MGMTKSGNRAADDVADFVERISIVNRSETTLVVTDNAGNMKKATELLHKLFAKTSTGAHLSFDL